jgi:hypothetical protein
MTLQELAARLAKMIQDQQKSSVSKSGSDVKISTQDGGTTTIPAGRSVQVQRKSY